MVASITRLLASAALVSVATAAVAKPNFVLIVTDDMGYNDFSVYGHPTIETPNLDRSVSTKHVMHCTWSLALFVNADWPARG